MKNRIGSMAAMAALALGCSDSPGTVNVTIWGETFIETQIGPAATVDDEGGFQNGWTLTFNRFLINVADVNVANSDGTNGGALPAAKVYNLHITTGSGVAVGSLSDVPAGRMDRVSFRIGPATAASTAGNASAADLMLMQQNGYSVYVEASATREGRTTPLQLRWGFTTNTRFNQCHGEENQLGLAVPSGGSVRGQITIHGDHFFYDSLQGETDAMGNSLTRLRFDVVAGADANMDNMVTLDELAAVDLTRVPEGQYRSGNIPNINNLLQFITYQTRSLGHFNGEGECTPERLP